MNGAPQPPPSQEGLAAERTALAWVRMGLALLGVPGALIAYAAGRNWLAFAAAAIAAGLGLGLLLVSLRSERAGHSGLALRETQAAPLQVLLTAADTAMISLACMLLVFEAR